MKRIKVSFNPKETPIKYPSEVKTFYCGAVGLDSIIRQVKQWCKKDGKVFISLEVENVIDAEKDAIPGDDL